MRLPIVALSGAMLLAPATVQARDYCSTRPSLGQSACVLDPGRVAVEAALSDWERDGGTDTVLFGDTLVRLGLTDRIEAQIGWTPLGIARDRSDGSQLARVGDATIGARINLHNPDGGGLSYGLQPSLTLPVGRTPISDPAWSASMIAPISYDLNDTLNLQFSPQLQYAADDDGQNHRIVPSATLGLGIALTPTVDLTAEAQWTEVRGGDEARVALAFAWQVSPDLFIDMGGVAGLNRDTPAARVYSGISRRF
jgi:Putative MetA-pathway of phenol degradation